MEGTTRNFDHVCKNCGHKVMQIRGVWYHFFKETRAVRAKRNICGYICKHRVGNNECDCTKPEERKMTKLEWRQYYETNNNRLGLSPLFYA